MTTSEVRCRGCGKRNRFPIASAGRARCAACHADLPWLVDVTGDDLDEVIRRSPVPVLVDLWAPWCGPCRIIAPALADISAERAGALRVAKVNVDEWPQVSARLGVQGIPTMVLFVDGQEAGRQVGALPADGIERWLDSTLSTPGSSSRSTPRSAADR